MTIWVTVQDCMGLQGFPAMPQNVRCKLDKLSNGNKRKRKGTKAWEYPIYCLPLDTQIEIKDKYYKKIISQKIEAQNLSVKIKNNTTLDLVRQCPTLLENKTSELNEKQRATADARCALVQEVLKLESEAGMPRIKAMTYLSELSKAEQLPDNLKAVAELANAKKGKRVGFGVRMLNQWVVDYLKAKDSAERLFLLAPSKHQPVKPENIAWLPDFLEIYRNPNSLNIKRAYNQFRQLWMKRYQGQDNALLACPSYDAVKYAMKKLPVLTKEKFRKTGSAWRSLNPFVNRNWETIPVNGVWVGDGHNMKMDVAHPDHGRPFSPEITLVIDARTRYIVGWSLSLSENHLAVADALRHAMETNGKPLVYYSDNGSGQKNKILDADVTGILPRLGIEHQTGIPGNPQGRGIIERLNKEVPSIIAQQFDTYHGKDADRETVRITKKAVDSAINALNQGKALNIKQEHAINKLPTWSQLIDVIEQEVFKYNTHHEHRSLPKNSNTGKHYSPAEYRNHLIRTENEVIDYLSPIEMRDMFRPQVRRKADRGQIRLFNNVYFAMELANHHGDEVLVGFDIHDPNSVIVRDLNGKYICDAIWNGNQRDAFPKAYYGQGKLYLAPLNTKKQWRWIGDVSEFNINISFEEREKKSSLGGRLITTKRHITAVSASVSMLLHEVSSDNLSLLFQANQTHNKQSNQSETFNQITAGDMITLKHHNVRYIEIDGLDEGVDYKADNAFGSVEFIKTPQLQPVIISYDLPDEERLGILNASPKEYALRYEGVNLANDGCAVHVELYRLSFDPEIAFELINSSSNLTSIEVNAKMLPDISKMANAPFGLFGKFITSSNYKLITYDGSIGYEGHHQHVY